MLIPLQIFDKFIPCLKDSNAKVNLYALQVMLDVTPILCDSMGGVINLTTQTVASNLSSKNTSIHETAEHVLDAFIDNFGKLCLQCVLLRTLEHIKYFSNRGFAYLFISKY